MNKIKCYIKSNGTLVLKPLDRQELAKHTGKYVQLIPYNPEWVNCDECKGLGKVKEKKRTNPQNNSLHLFCTQLANKLNEMGLDVRTVMKPTYEIWWTKYMVKDHLWRFFQRKKFGKESTTELSKHEEIDAIHEDLMRNLGEKHHVEYIKFPHRCPQCKHVDCVCN